MASASRLTCPRGRSLVSFVHQTTPMLCFWRHMRALSERQRRKKMQKSQKEHASSFVCVALPLRFKRDLLVRLACFLLKQINNSKCTWWMSFFWQVRQYLELHPGRHHDWSEGERVRADGGDHDGWDVGMDHGSSCCHCVRCAACGCGDYHTWVDRDAKAHFHWSPGTSKECNEGQSSACISDWPSPLSNSCAEEELCAEASRHFSS